jgi:hypothetical protein
MWRWLAAFRCGRCGGVRGARHRALRSPLRAGLAICGDCLERWERSGHRCARCWRPIRDRLDVGFLLERRAFLHVDCGGARVVRTDLGPMARPAARS